MTMAFRRVVVARVACAALALLAFGPAFAQTTPFRLPPSQQSVEDLALFRRPLPDIGQATPTAPRSNDSVRRAAPQRPRTEAPADNSQTPARRAESPTRRTDTPARRTGAQPDRTDTPDRRGAPQPRPAAQSATPQRQAPAAPATQGVAGQPPVAPTAQATPAAAVDVARTLADIQPAQGPAAPAQQMQEPPPVEAAPPPPAAPSPPAATAPSASERSRPAARAPERVQPPNRQRQAGRTTQPANPPPAPAPAPQAAPEPPAAPEPAPPAAPAAASQPTPPTPAREQVVRVDAMRNAEGIELRFNWNEPVAAAVFARGPTLWIVFDSRRALDLAAMRSLSDELGEIDVAIGELTAIRVAPGFGAVAAARREGDIWVIDLLRRTRLPASPIALTVRQSEANRPRLWAALPGAQRVVQLNDPEIGDSIQVAPTTAAGHGVAAPRSFVQFRLPATAQGLVVEPRSDDVQVRALGGGIDVASARGVIAGGSAEAGADGAASRRSTLFDLDAWRGGGPAQFMDERMALQRAVAAAREETRGEARAALAQFLFAHGFAVDALGVMRLIEQEHPAVLESARMRAIRGVAALLAGDLELAARNLRHASLADHPEAALWRAMLALGEGDTPRAVAELAQTRDTSDRYPAPFANRLGLTVAEIRLAGESVEAAEDRVNAVLANQPTPTERARAEFLRGRLFLARGQRERALEIWARLEQGPMAPARVLATIARIETQLEDRSIEPSAAVDTLDRLRFSWRGDMLEFRILARLGRLYESIGDTRRALAALRDGLTVLPNHPETATLRSAAVDMFARYVLDGAFDRANPITALALFEEGRNLLPNDARRPRMVLRAADRMIALDLLERAAATLERELREEISGADRALFGARLALVRLLDRKPQEAIDALAMSASTAASPELQRERQLLEARALADLDQVAPALALIGDDQSEESDRLRADLQLRMRDWASLATTLARLAGEPRDNALSDDSARTVLHLTVAVVLGEDRDGLRRLREHFAPAMRASRYKDLFEVLTSERGPPPEDMRAVAARITTVAPFQSFLAQYRERLARPAAGS